ncbi:IucA/IucC family protein [Duganella sp. Dugasp56]|uniref:IucA/IucC family protein n=1 Tax=Duganella sp. Dugasp56 TaxID=3243046 RepID=UPI0039AEDCB1
MPHTLPFLPHYAAAHARTLRQFIEAFWNEGCLSGAAEPAQRRLRLDGMGEQGQALTYHIDIAGDSAFGRLRLDGELRGAGPGQPGIATVVPALVRHLQPDAAALRRFVTELQHTALKQAWSATATPDATLQSPYALQEAQLGDGHPYHPCFRSRIGFSIDDHRRYGPEFAATVTLTWLAIARDASEVHLLPELDYDAFVRSQLGTEEYRRLLGQIEVLGCTPSHYRLLPAHPWQWEHGIALHFADWLADSTLLHLGAGRAEWLAQQSIRSLSRLGADGRCNLKLPLAIANSSADRILSDHHVHNAPLISRWLDGICRNDTFLADGQRLAILAEPAGITVAKEHRREGAYGMLGAIWRSAPESVLAEGEQVFPMTALTTLAGGQLTIAPWLARHGVDRWVEALLEASVPPLLHLMMAHGVLLECHAQNTLLILRDGLPRRIAIRDLPGGLHYLKGATGEAELAGLRAAPAYRNALNASNGFMFDSPTEARDYLLEVLFFINLGELAWRLQRHHGYAENLFWSQAARTVLAYQSRFPASAARHREFDLLGQQLRIECLAARRLLEWSTPRLRTVGNPLAAALATGSQA